LDVGHEESGDESVRHVPADAAQTVTPFVSFQVLVLWLCFHFCLQSSKTKRIISRKESIKKK